MSTWMTRPTEERTLLNPGFSSCLLWQSAIGYESVANNSLPLGVAFLVLPTVLHRDTRQTLPKSTATSLAVWVARNEVARATIAEQGIKLVPFTKEAMIFGGIHGLVQFTDGAIHANGNWRRPVSAYLKDATEEARECAERAGFVGRWFARSGSASTIMAILGVRP